MPKRTSTYRFVIDNLLAGHPGRNLLKIKRLLLVGLVIGITCGHLSACRMTPKPTSVAERYKRAQEEVHQMFAGQPPVLGEMDFNQAMARGLQFNLDHRIKQVNTAINAGQMKVAEFAMLPDASVSGSVYNRNNDNSSRSGSGGNNQSSSITNSSDRTLRSARAGIKWNVLDFGLGYVKAREEGERLLIAEEESRKQLQELVQDVRVAYWRAYYAQQLSHELKEFQSILQQSNDMLAKALVDKTIPQEEILYYQSSLLEGNRRLVQLEEKLLRAKLEFTHLINLPVDQPVVLKKPPVAITKIQDLQGIDFVKLDAITLVNRPELRSQDYQRRIAKLGTKAAVLQALPGISLNKGRNYNSNSFLVNNFWNDRSVEASWNIFNLAALPVTLDTAKTQAKYETLKLMALTLSVLNETRVSYTHYKNLARECKVARNQTINTEKIYKLLSQRETAKLASKQQVVLARLHMVFAKMDEVLLLSDLSTALGELYLASGFDILPIDATSATPSEVLHIIEENLHLQDNMDFKSYVNATYERMFEKNEEDLT